MSKKPIDVLPLRTEVERAIYAAAFMAVMQYSERPNDPILALVIALGTVQAYQARDGKPARWRLDVDSDGTWPEFVGGAQ